jgi:Xaa-Pro dipeptidase
MAPLTANPQRYDRRIGKVRALLAARGKDAFVSQSPTTIAYLAGFQALMYSRPIYLVVTATAVEMVVPGLEEEHAGHAIGVDRVTVYYEHPEKGTRGENAQDTLIAVLQRLGVKRAGIEFSAPIAVERLLTGNGLTVVDFAPDIIRMRLVKDAEEIELMRLASRLAHIGVMTTLRSLKEGLSQIAVESAGTNAILEAVPEIAPFATVHLFQFTTSGPETSLPHLITSSRRLERPDIGIHSRQVSVDGERSELERTFAIGTMTPEIERIFRVAEEAQWAAMAAIKPGIPMSAVDTAARSIIQKAGYGEYSIHRTGHGLGVDAHEAPYVRWDHDDLFEPGMVVSIEPGIYIRGVCGARHSDTVVVTETGHEIITEAPYGVENLTF